MSTLYEDLDETNKAFGGNVMPDPTVDWKLRQQQVDRRRKQALELAAKGMQTDGQMVGRIYVAKNPWQNFLESAFGSGMGASADADEAKLALQQRMAQSDFNNRFAKAKDTPTSPQFGPGEDGGSLPDVPNGPTRRELLMQADAGGLRTTLAREFMKSDEDRDYRAQQAELARLAREQEKEADRKARAQDRQDQREWLEGQNKLYRRTAEQLAASGGGNRRDRFQIIADADGQQYRVNLDTGEKTPLGLVKPAGAKGAPGEKALTEAQGNAYLFGTRADQAHKVLGDVGTDYSPMKVSIASAMDKVPGVNVGANAVLTDKEQKVAQAQRDFVNAVLRKESGAAIAQSEFDNARKQYFPQPGDSAAVIAQKKANRETAIKGLAKIVGPQGADIGKPQQPTVVRTGTRNGVRVEQLSDGSIREVK